MGLGGLARRISAWTTNSLLTVMLLVIALGFGREVLHWWHEDGTAPPAGPLAAHDPLGDDSVPHELEFGDQTWSIRRQEFSGPPGEVAVALQAACRTAIVDSRPRGESPDAAEQELLKRLARERPVAEERGQWRLYQWGAGHPVLIGTRAVGAKGQKMAETTPSGGPSLAETPYRVVIWGVAAPAGPWSADAWTLYLFQSGGTAGGQGQSEGAIPLPPGGHRLLSIRAAGGGAITAFSANEGDAARTFYDRWFAEHAWTVASGWRSLASGWHARFELRSHVPARAIDIRLGTDSQGRWTGLLMESQVEREKP